jgi:hypothetical protein
MLANLASVSNVPLPEPSRGTGQKRSREPEQAAATDPTSSPVFTEAEGPRLVAGSRRMHAFPSPPLERAPVFAIGAPSFGLALAAEPGTSLGMSAQGPVPSANTPPGGWAQAPTSLLSYSGHPDEHTIDNSALPVGASASAFAPILDDAGEQLMQWWADPDPGAAVGYHPGPDRASGTDPDAIGDALDGLLSQPGHGGAGLHVNDPLALWTQTTMEFG